MNTRSARTLYTACAVALSGLLAATPVHAQFQPRQVDDLPLGEKYRIEGGAGFWFPVADITIASESLGIPGTLIDLEKDLGLKNQHFPELHFEVRPIRSQKFHFQYIPISYEQSATLTRDIVFNGQRYRAGLPAASKLDWKAFRFGYEYDFITTNRGFAGFVLDFKYTDVKVSVSNLSLDLEEFAEARAPIPAVGGIGRVYVTPNISITGEVTGFKLPDKLIEDSSGHYLDIDIYATADFTKNVGVRVGFRSFDVGYVVKTDTGSFNLKGLFFGIVARY